ncbi:adenosylmethionine-8-amino-7-oxononanoate transaminase [Sugiyamaella lignohabitans]|uniref:Adenosylmethionine-8-amino-7-oxononanoate transaminase n=1 Tax=Sugiyamaella lignohabitans TaxID=796027 RepID=A0A167DEU3_9ASCO|nr:adenosylmethionine-8-amino-7-oxononanoate transaminase [Sugiyamaella lignohabitans]ANB12834.1 adenosylmethionine-8-amino-7-oxononanoate transaminase [Sugiyamaella lignohabitans]
MASRADKTIWFPFSQHKNIPEKSITTIDSAYNDSFQTFNSIQAGKSSSLLNSSFDGSASWWTQGLGHGNPTLSLAAAYAAGRYGHVILASTIHQPAISLAENIISKLGNPRVNRVFYSDNGSTGIEVAIKMALKSACDRYGWDVSDKDIGVIGLKRSYHGDTIGSMDCTEPSVYNKKITWYKDRGYWFEYPNVVLKNGVWKVVVPESLQNELGASAAFSSLDEIYDIENRDGSHYKRYIKEKITDLINQGHKFGAVIFEPVLLGAGGMLAV